MASLPGQWHLQNEATEPSESRQDRTERFQNQLASLQGNSEVVTSLSSFYNINNFIAIHAACGNPHGDDSSGTTDHDDDDDSNYGFSDLPSQGHGSYNSGPSNDIRLNDSRDLSQLDAGDGAMGCMGAERGCTGAELCTSGRYNQGPSKLPGGAEYCVTGEPDEQTALKTTAPLHLAEEHAEHPASNCGKYIPLQTNSSGYITEAISAANIRDHHNRFSPILEAFFESWQTSRKENQQTTGQHVEDVEENLSTVATADESQAQTCSHSPASALAAAVAARRNRDEEEDEEDDEVAMGDEELTENKVAGRDVQLGNDDEVAVSDEESREDEVAVCDEELREGDVVRSETE